MTSSPPHRAPPAPTTLELADRLSQELRAALARGDLELPPLRQSVTQVLELCNRPQFEVHQVVDVVHTDPALAGHLLHVANSAAFGARHRIDSITEAVARLGSRQLQAVAAGLMLKADLFRGSVRMGTRMRRMWHHAAIAGLYARDLGQLTGVEPRNAMLVGLLHDVGQPFVLRQLVELESITGTTVDDEALDDVIEVLHAPLGAELARAWGLSERLVAAIAHHHEWDAAAEHADVAMLAHVADAFATWAVAPTVEGGQELLQLGVARELRLTRRKLGALLRAHRRLLRAALHL